MKKIIALLSLLIMCMPLFGCKDKNDISDVENKYETAMEYIADGNYEQAYKLLYLCRNPYKNNLTMARPIKETPVLRGKDAENFAKRLANPKPVSNAEKEAALKAYEAFKAISTFPM